jgi:hypothetical protein
MIDNKVFGMKEGALGADIFIALCDRAIADAEEKLAELQDVIDANKKIKQRFLDTRERIIGNA